MKKIKRFRKRYIIYIFLIIIIFLMLDSIKYETRFEKTDKDATREIDIWTIQGCTGEAIERVVRRIEKENSNLKFNITQYENEIYKKMIKDVLVTNEGPDMFFVWGDRFLYEFVNGGMVLDITEKYNDYNKLNEEVMRAFKYNSKIYGIPIQGFNVLLYVNNDIFEKYNIKICTTYYELLNIIETVKGEGIIPIAIGGEETWMLSFLYMTLALREYGLEEVEEIIKNEKFVNEEPGREAASKVIELVEKGAFGEQFLHTSPIQAVKKFVNGEAAMLFAGSFNSNAIDELNHGKKINISAIQFPITSSNSTLQEGVGGFTESFVINQNSSNKEVLEEIYIEMMNELTNELVVEEVNGIPIVGEFPESFNKESTIYKSWLAFPKEGYHLPYDLVMPKGFTIKHFKAIEELFKENITPEEFMELQK